MSRAFYLTAPDEELAAGVRAVSPESVDAATLRALDDEVWSVTGFEADLTPLLAAVARLLGRDVVALRTISALAEDLQDCRSLVRGVRDELARLDDTKLGPLGRDLWARLGHDGEPDPDWTQELRTLVIQCRAAQANGWDVYVCSIT